MHTRLHSLVLASAGAAGTPLPSLSIIHLFLFHFLRGKLQLGCSANSPNSLHPFSTFSLSQVTFRWVLCRFWGSSHVGGRSLDLANLFHTGLFAQRWPFYWHIELVEALVSKCVAKSYFSGFLSFPLACFGTGGGSRMQQLHW